jgi:hypothetical protein
MLLAYVGAVIEACEARRQFSSASAPARRALTRLPDLPVLLIRRRDVLIPAG